MHTFIRVGSYLRRHCVGVRPGDIVCLRARCGRTGPAASMPRLNFLPFPIPMFLSHSARPRISWGMPATPELCRAKDSVLRPAQPGKMAVAWELLAKWEAWKSSGCWPARMEASTLFTVGSLLGVRCRRGFMSSGIRSGLQQGLTATPTRAMTPKGHQTAVTAVGLLIKGRFPARVIGCYSVMY